MSFDLELLNKMVMFLITRLVSIGNLEAAVSLLLSTPPESSYFSANALRAVALSSAVSTSLLELAVKVLISLNVSFWPFPDKFLFFLCVGVFVKSHVVMLV